ncbi:MAG: hypothetical protein EU542_05210 [Promethearchaeota archaeon]|nr:MAG: hypothetical protein EU542_05210 [Candidatus Lokiarchaeota archaeon]
MGRKKKIREEFEAVFQAGNEKKIKEMLDENPWLLDEVSSAMDENMLNQHQVIAALGVMEDDLGGPVMINDILTSLNLDFHIEQSEDKIKKILDDVLGLGLVKRESSGWVLTKEGGRICDDYLNRHLKDLIS